MINQNDLQDERRQDTPEDVAALYAWANLHNVKYRDFSANRREHRAQQQMQRPAVVVRPDPPTPLPKITAVAANTPREGAHFPASDSVISRRTGKTVVPAGVNVPGKVSDPYVRSERGEQETAPAAGPSQAKQKLERFAADLQPVFTRQEPAAGPSRADNTSMAEAAAVRETAARDAYVPPAPHFYPDPARPERTAFQNGAFAGYPGSAAAATVEPPPSHLPGPGVQYVYPDYPRPEQIYTQPPQFSPAPSVVTGYPASYPASFPASGAQGEPFSPPASPPPIASAPQQGFVPPANTQWQPQYPAVPEQRFEPSPTYSTVQVSRNSFPTPAGNGFPSPEPVSAAQTRAAQAPPPVAERPAWLHQEAAPALQPDSLEHTRERVASRWFALRGVLNAGSQDREGQARPQEHQAPMLAVFSLAGGVGKTSLVATLGRSLAAFGERVLLADTNSYGLLPFYYGARELRPSVVRTFSPPSGTGDVPVLVVNHDADARPSGENGQDQLLLELVENSRGANRVIVDLATASSASARRILRLSPIVLVPIVPDMSSVIGLAAVQQFFRGSRSMDGQSVQPYYLLNQYDAAQPLHLDVREVLRQQLGDRLLPIAIRRSPAVSEALAEGMTVVDYAPKSPIAEDFKGLAGWLRSVTASEAQGFRGMRWSEK